MLKVIIKQDTSWRQHHLGSSSLWFKGYLYNKSVDDVLKDLQDFGSMSIPDYLLNLNGHFAFVFQNNESILVAVDRVRSIPLFYNLHGISSNPTFLGNHASVNPDAVLSLRMAGYTIGADTIYKGLESLIAGQFLIATHGDIERENYYQYKPWLPPRKSSDRNDLAKITLAILKKLVENLNGRQVVIPLSAGNDSRLIASGLKHLGYKNVKCYSYGIAGNFEARIARIISDKLGYDFKFIPLNLGEERKFYRSNKFKEYLAFAETFVAVPYFQSLSTIPKLKNWIDSDAVFINGNSGDFISGGHVSSAFCSTNSVDTERERLNVVNKAIMDKNFSLWDYLKTELNIKNIERQLTSEMPVPLRDVSSDHGLYEYSELENRQSKYVISGQRAYEFYGYEWRLPLWDESYLEFWETVPLNLKFNQKLYTDMLRAENWGGVWDGAISVNKKTVRPLWVIPLRLLIKPVFIFSGKKRWHQFETIFFYYFMDVTRMMCSINYLSVLRAVFKKPRHHVSWQVDEYLNSKNIK